MEKYQIGERLAHPKFGPGTVVDVESDDIIVIKFDSAGRKRIAVEFAPLSRDLKIFEEARIPGSPEYQKRIQDTFKHENEGTEHFLGGHWAPFADDATGILKRLPEILPKAVLQESYDSFTAKTPLKLPPSWPSAIYMVWPQRIQGLSIVIEITERGNIVSSIFPFDQEGSQHEIVFEKVHVWQSGIEAQIECSIGSAIVAFYDTQYAVNRHWYESGSHYQFILTGFAYYCRNADDQTTRAKNPSDAAFHASHPDLNWPEGDSLAIHTKGMASLIPLRSGDRDDYAFRGTVKAVKEIEMLDQQAWRVRVTVLRDIANNKEMDLDIIITKRIWNDNNPPAVGNDIEGSLWLQGYLAFPGRQPRLLTELKARRINRDVQSSQRSEDAVSGMSIVESHVAETSGEEPASLEQTAVNNDALAVIEEAIDHWEKTVPEMAKGWHDIDEYTFDLDKRDALEKLIIAYKKRNKLPAKHAERIAETDRIFRAVTIESKLCVWHIGPQFRHYSNENIELLFWKRQFDPERYWYFYRWLSDCPHDFRDHDGLSYQKEHFGMDFLVMTNEELKDAARKAVARWHEERGTLRRSMDSRVGGGH